ncbi:MAG: Plug domain-containing protein [Bdellovibrionaceae bacterium]|nr:Plug domain-containing protein [Pseudobdellovibrionaceae bacterium]
MKQTALFITLFLILHPFAVGAAEEVSELPAVVVTPDGKELNNRRSYTTDKVEVLKKDRIEKSTATSLNEAMDRMPGVDSHDYCVNCGAKRISINGLRGDHTSVLVDGIPLYSAVTSVYGYDAIPMQSIHEIEVKRGTGGALINPEAIGAPSTSSRSIRRRQEAGLLFFSVIMRRRLTNFCTTTFSRTIKSPSAENSEARKPGTWIRTDSRRALLRAVIRFF